MIKEIQESLRYRFKKSMEGLIFVKDEYGHPELRIEKTIFRFWMYPSYWRYLFRKLAVKWKDYYSNKKTACYLTTIIPETGIGHQLTCWNTALIFSLKYNFKFVHFPLHAYDGVDWESFLGFGDGELNYTDLIRDISIRKVNLPRIRRIDKTDINGHYTVNQIITSEIEAVSSVPSKKGILFILNPDHFAYDQTKTSEILRDKYWKMRDKKPVKVDLVTDRINIACHVRRGDIMKSNTPNSPDLQNFGNRWVDNNYFVKVIKTLKEVLFNHDLNIHIFSQGLLSDFRDYEKFGNVIFHLDEAPNVTFHRMVVADILILSPSSFSYKAGMISRGTKIAKHPWWHEIPSNNEWIRSNEQGEFNIKPIVEKFLSAS